MTYNNAMLNKPLDYVISGAGSTGAKTVATTAAEIFSGASRLASRYCMAIYNDSTVDVYWGFASNITTSTGYILRPGDSIVLRFDPKASTPIYCISSTNANVRVVELK